MIRLTLELNEVTVGTDKVKYLSTMCQEDIDKYCDYYDDTHRQYFPVINLTDLKYAAIGMLDNAEEHVWIKVPIVPGVKALRERILNRYPHCKIEEVKNLDWCS